MEGEKYEIQCEKIIRKIEQENLTITVAVFVYFKLQNDDQINYLKTKILQICENQSRP